MFVCLSVNNSGLQAGICFGGVEFVFLGFISSSSFRSLVVVHEYAPIIYVNVTDLRLKFAHNSFGDF